MIIKISVSACYKWYAEKMELNGPLTKEERQLALLEYILEKKHVSGCGEV